jgi:hypothetical protein
MNTLKIRIVLFTFCVYFTSVVLSAEPYKIALSEIQMLPTHTNDPVRIELVNRTEQSVDMTGWYMTDGYGHRYDFPKLLAVPKGALVVISFVSMQVKEPDDLEFSDNVAYLYCNKPWAGQAFRGRSNECALFEPSTDGKMNGKIHDYIVWGWGERPGYDIYTLSDAYKQALAEKVWFMDDVFNVNEERMAGGPLLLQGGSLARMNFKRKRIMSKEWLMNAPSDVSIGMQNSWPVPRLTYPSDKMSYELKNPRGFSWEATCGTNDTFLFQLSKSKAFTDLILERVVPSIGVSYDQFREGTYYWRVCINAPEAERKWSEVSEFSLVDMTKRRPWQPGDPRVRFKGKNYEDKEPKPVQ